MIFSLILMYYCGVGTSMFMTGFVSVATEEEGSTACVNLFFDDWTLDSKVSIECMIYIHPSFLFNLV